MVLMRKVTHFTIHTLVHHVCILPKRWGGGIRRLLEDEPNGLNLSTKKHQSACYMEIWAK